MYVHARLEYVRMQMAVCVVYVYSCWKGLIGVKGGPGVPWGSGEAAVGERQWESGSGEAAVGGERHQRHEGTSLDDLTHLLTNWGPMDVQRTPWELPGHPWVAT